MSENRASSSHPSLSLSLSPQQQQQRQCPERRREPQDRLLLATTSSSTEFHHSEREREHHIATGLRRTQRRLPPPMRKNSSSRRNSSLLWFPPLFWLWLLLHPSSSSSSVEAFGPSSSRRRPAGSLRRRRRGDNDALSARLLPRIRNNNAAVGALGVRLLRSPQPQPQSQSTRRKKSATAPIRRSLSHVFRRKQQQHQQPPMCQPAAVSSSSLMMASILEEPVETTSRNNTEDLISSSASPLLLDDEGGEGDDEEQIPYYAQQEHLERIHFATAATPAQLTASSLGRTAAARVSSTTNPNNNIRIRGKGGANISNEEEEEEEDVSEVVLTPAPEQDTPKNGAAASSSSSSSSSTSTESVAEKNTVDAKPADRDTTKYDENSIMPRKLWQRGPLRFFRTATKNGNNNAETAAPPTIHSMWRHRHARSAEEGIRREVIDATTTTRSSAPRARRSVSSARQLRSVLAKANGSIERTSRHYAARTIAGLLHALAEEVADLDVDVESRRDTPWHRKRVDAVRIQFSRLGFKPLRMGGHDSIAQRQRKAALRRDNDDNLALLYRNWKDHFAAARKSLASKYAGGGGGVTLTADEAFDRIDVDQSGFLDRDELIQALTLAARTASTSNSNTTDGAIVLLDEVSTTNYESNQAILEDLAADLFELYDLNGDGVVDRKEYKNMVEDMAALRKAEARSRLATADEAPTKAPAGEDGGWLEKAAGLWQNRTWPRSALFSDDARKKNDGGGGGGGGNATATGPLAFFDKMKKANVDDATSGSSSSSSDDDDNNNNNDQNLKQSQEEQELVDVSSEVVGEVTKTFGSITFSDLKMDLRQILFGGIPIVKRITPGGPLILEPFKATVTGSFNREDIMNSVLLDMALKRLVMRVVRKRVGGLRDILEGAVFKGRSWKTFGGEGGPKVEITELTNVEFDPKDKLIITGRARVRPRPDAAVIEQAFKVRTSIGTGMNGRSIRLEEPELALVAECPKSWERGIGALCDALTIRKPPRPEPLYSFFPIYSPFKLNDDPGFYLGEDNEIESLYIQDGALRFEMSAVLRPGRFLGSHYIAFTVPQRTFIVTLDRVREGIQSARKVKKAARALKHASDRRAGQSRESAEDAAIVRRVRSKRAAGRKPKMRSFFSRFVDGYLQAERDDADKERLTTAIRDFFGRQESS